MGIIMYGMLMGHVVGYKDEYMKIAVSFATTMMVKLVIKSAGNKDHATMIGLGGGFVVIKNVFELLDKVTKRGFDVKDTVGGENGIVGDIIKSIGGLLTTPKE